MVDPFSAEFAANDAIIAYVTEWLAGIWRSIDGMSLAVPLDIAGHDGVSMTPPLTIHTTQNGG
jgi:hypothetical protein